MSIHSLLDLSTHSHTSNAKPSFVMLMQIFQYWVKGESEKLSICGTTERK